MTQKPLPIVPWMGGKRRLAKHLLPMFPEHTCYVELFAGGAALFFMRPQPAKVEVLNDLNGQLINLYRVVQHHFDEFVRQFQWTLTSREVFARLQSTPPDCMTDIQRAARFSICNIMPLEAKFAISTLEQLQLVRHGMQLKLQINFKLLVID